MEISIKDPYGFIYITTNMINGKKYIGQRRFVDYGGKKWIDYLGSGKLLKEAINKYGRDNFYREIVAIAYSKEELNNLEINFIKEHNAIKIEIITIYLKVEIVELVKKRDLPIVMKPKHY